MPNIIDTKSAAIRAKLNHPIIDSDGHTAEFEPALFDYFRDIGGSQTIERFKKAPDVPFHFGWYELSREERRNLRAPRPHWWVHPTKNTLDRATSALPKPTPSAPKRNRFGFQHYLPQHGHGRLAYR